MPLIDEDAHIREAVIHKGSGLKRGVAMILCKWVENLSEDEPDCVKAGVLERLWLEAEGLSKE